MKTIKLTTNSKNLLLAIYKDLPNWDNCSPGYNHIDAVSRGNLMDLKKKKLAAVFKDEGKEWITLTDAGKALAKSLNGEAPTVVKKTTAKKATKASKLKPSWLVGRLRNALHKTNPSLKEGKSLKEVSSLEDIKVALAMPRDEWESLLGTFFNLGGKLAE